MEYWVIWTIVAAIGVVVGFILHAAFKNTQGVNTFVTLIGGLLGAVIGAFYLAPYYREFTLSAETTLLTMRFIWAIIGSLVLSTIVEMLFVGTRRGRVVMT